MGFLEVVQSSHRAIVMHQRAWGVLGVWGFVSIVSESRRMVGMESEEWQGIDLGSDRILAIGWGSQQLNT